MQEIVNKLYSNKTGVWKKLLIIYSNAKRISICLGWAMWKLNRNEILGLGIERTCKS
jgi:hypothetical protein